VLGFCVPFDQPHVTSIGRAVITKRTDLQHQPHRVCLACGLCIYWRVACATRYPVHSHEHAAPPLPHPPTHTKCSHSRPILSPDTTPQNNATRPGWCADRDLELTGLPIPAGRFGCLSCTMLIVGHSLLHSPLGFLKLGSRTDDCATTFASLRAATGSVVPS